MGRLSIIFVTGLLAAACGVGPLVGDSDGAPERIEYDGNALAPRAESPGDPGDDGEDAQYADPGEDSEVDDSAPWSCTLPQDPTWLMPIDDLDFNYGAQEISHPDGQADLFGIGHLWGGGFFGRIRDGQIYRGGWYSEMPVALDAAWERGVFMHTDQESLVVRNLPSQEFVQDIQIGGPLGNAYNLRASLDASGEILTTADCEEVAPQTWSTVYRRYDLTLPGEQASQPLWTRNIEGQCGQNWNGISQLIQLPEEDAIIALGLTENAIVRLNADGAVNSLTTFDLGDHENTWPMPTILDATQRPGRSEIHLTTSEGDHRVLNTQTMSFVEHSLADRAVGVMTANPMSYGPTTESPLAFSPTGLSLVRTDESGAVELVDLLGTSEDQAIAVPFSSEEPEWGPGPMNIPLAFSFTKRGLLGSFTGGFAFWACDALPEVDVLDSTLQITAPESAQAREEVVITVENAHPGPAIYRLVLLDEENGNITLAVSLTRELQFSIWSEGPLTLQVELDTGAQVKTSEIFVVDILPEASP
jgi:hypothetical protein